MSSYLQLFASLAESSDWQLDGENMLVETFDAGEDSKEVTRADGSKASLILASAPTRQMGGFADMKPIFMRVLKVGRGYIAEDGSHEPIDLKPGAIIEVPKMSVSWRSKILGLVVTGDNSIGYVTRSSVMQSFPSEEAYRRVEKALKQG